MNVVFALVAVSVVLVIAIAIVLIWAVRAGQFEDMEGPAWRVLMDDDRPIVGDDADQGANDRTDKPAGDKLAGGVLNADRRNERTPQDKPSQSQPGAMNDKDQ